MEYYWEVVGSEDESVLVNKLMGKCARYHEISRTSRSRAGGPRIQRFFTDVCGLNSPVGSLDRAGSDFETELHNIHILQIKANIHK